MNKDKKKINYLRIFLLYGIVYATIPIIFTEITWDILSKIVGLKEGLFKELLESFLRAALLEETFKFYGFIKAHKEYHFDNEKEYMLGAGMIGLAYAIIEKVVTANPIAIILGIIFPMHILWQMNQGRHYYQYEKAKKKNNLKKAKKELLQATIVIFLLHGIWDALISLVGYFANDSKIANADMIGGSIFLITIALGTIYIILSIIKIIKVFKNNK